VHEDITYVLQALEEIQLDKDYASSLVRIFSLDSIDMDENDEITSLLSVRLILKALSHLYWRNANLPKMEELFDGDGWGLEEEEPKEAEKWMDVRVMFFLLYDIINDVELIIADLRYYVTSLE